MSRHTLPGNYVDRRSEEQLLLLVELVTKRMIGSQLSRADWDDVTKKFNEKCSTPALKTELQKIWKALTDSAKHVRQNFGNRVLNDPILASVDKFLKNAQESASKSRAQRESVEIPQESLRRSKRNLFSAGKEENTVHTDINLLDMMKDKTDSDVGAEFLEQASKRKKRKSQSVSKVIPSGSGVDKTAAVGVDTRNTKRLGKSDSEPAKEAGASLSVEVDSPGKSERSINFTSMRDAESPERGDVGKDPQIQATHTSPKRIVPNLAKSGQSVSANNAGMVPGFGIVANNVVMVRADNHGGFATNGASVTNDLRTVKSNLGFTGYLDTEVVTTNHGSVTSNNSGMGTINLNHAGTVSNNTVMVTRNSAVPTNNSEIVVNYLEIPRGILEKAANNIRIAVINTGMTMNDTGMAVNKAGMAANRSEDVADNCGTMTNPAEPVANRFVKISPPKSPSGLLQSPHYSVSDPNVQQNASLCKTTATGNVCSLLLDPARFVARNDLLLQHQVPLQTLPTIEQNPKETNRSVDNVLCSKVAQEFQDIQLCQTKELHEAEMAIDKLADQKQKLHEAKITNEELVACQRHEFCEAKIAIDRMGSDQRRKLHEAKMKNEELVADQRRKLNEAKMKNEELVAGQRRNLHEEQMAIDKKAADQILKLHEAKMRNEELVADQRQKLHEARMKNEELIAEQNRKFEEARMEQSAQIAEQNQTLHEAQIELESQIIAQKEELHAENLRAIEQSMHFRQELHSVEMEAAHLKREAAEMKNKIVSLKLKKIELELEHMDAMSLGVQK